MKRKVLFVIHQLNFGGVQKALINSLKLIDYSENEVTVYIRKNKIDLIDKINENVKVIVNDDNTRYDKKFGILFLGIIERIATVFGKSTLRKSIHNKIVEKIEQKKIKYELKYSFNCEEQYDVAISYIQGYTAKFVIDCVNAARKYVFFHGSVDEDHELHELIFPKFDKIYTENLGCCRVMKNIYTNISDKFSYMDNYVDYKEIRNSAQNSISENSYDGLFITSCGRITKVKGFDLATEAAHILKGKNIGFKWYFVGDGPDRQKIEQLILQYGLEDNIVITGMQKNPYTYINACDIFVQPSYEEAFGLTISEALILGKPVVATKTVGATSQIKDYENGLLCDIDGKSLAEKISLLIKDFELLKKMSDNLSSIDYSEEKKKYCENWKKLLDGAL